MKLTKAIIAVAGYGTRRLPVSKSIEKCMMPVLNRPIVDYIVQDCIKAGITEIYMVINEGARQAPHFYSRDAVLEEYLRQHNKAQLISSIAPPEVTIHFVEQPINKYYGTTVPVWLCRDYIEPDEQFLFIAGDQFFYNEDGQSEAAHIVESIGRRQSDVGMLAVEVPHQDVSRYGILKVRQDGDQEIYEEIIEKPSIEAAPSNLNNGSFYLFNHQMLQYITEGMENLHDGEFMITDALNAYANAGNGVTVVRSRGQYLDCGNVEGWLYANSYIAERELQR